MTDALARAIRDDLGIVASTSGPDRIAYSRDLWPRHHLAVRRGEIAAHRPAAVAWPASTVDVARLVAFCARRGVPIVPFGAGSGVCAAVLPSPEMLVVDVKRMRAIRSLDRERGALDVEAGALGIRLEEELAGEGLTIGHFPSSILTSTVGGWVAARGAGQCSGRYGKIEDMVAALEIVDGQGEIRTLRRRTHGPDLLPLWIGSEGVLGVITAAQLRLHPAPKHREFFALSFPRMRDGWGAIRRMYQEGLRPAVCRLYDPFDSFLARRGAKKRSDTHTEPHETARPGWGSRLGKLAPGMGAVALKTLLRAPGAIDTLLRGLGDELLGGARLILIFEGTPEQAAGELVRARAIGRDAFASELGDAPARHWLEHRYSVSYRQAPMFMSGAFVDTMEVAAPWSRLEGLYDDVRDALGHQVFVMAHMSHAYPDGCSIYFTFAGSGATDADCERAYDGMWQTALAAVIAAGGTISHHHGVGRSKSPLLASELGRGVDLISAIRRTVDRSGILNPGNLEARARGPGPGITVSLPECPAVFPLDQLVFARGTSTLAAVEQSAARHGLSLGQNADLPPSTTTVAAWLAAGAKGSPDPWLDPVSHLVAGYRARLQDGTSFTVLPCPRRAAGPDLYALFHGTSERVGVIDAAWLHLRPRAPELASFPHFTGIERNPPLEPPERDFIASVLAGAIPEPSG